MARRKPQRYRGIARICNAAIGAKTRFHVSIFLTRDTSTAALIEKAPRTGLFRAR
jgi:hypothetical protein